MKSNRSNLVKETLVETDQYSIDVIVKDDYTHYIQITQLPSEKILQILPFDPTDNTVAGSINQETIDELGEDFLPVLSTALRDHMGAKELFVIPASKTLPEFVTPEESSFKRFRHCNRDALMHKTAAVLKTYPELKAELDVKYHFVTDENALMAGKDILERYQAVTGILSATARFTDGKTKEYEDEAVQGKMSRLKNKYVRPIVMLDKNTGNIVGMVRALLMGNQFAYLSDEVMNQEILSDEKCQGAVNRETFLLAYLLNKACEKLSDHTHLFMIAAYRREEIYANIGMESFPVTLDGWQAVMKFGDPESILSATKNRIASLPLPAAQADSALHTVGLFPAPASHAGSTVSSPRPE